MIPCSPGPEPEDFDARVRQRGLRWLENHPKPTSPSERKGWRPQNFWTELLPRLKEAFHDRCAYCAMYEPSPTVDHFVPCAADQNLIYEWSN